MKDRGWLFALACLVLTIALTYVFHACVEEVSKKLRDRFFPAAPIGDPAPVVVHGPAIGKPENAEA